MKLKNKRKKEKTLSFKPSECPYTSWKWPNIFCVMKPVHRPPYFTESAIKNGLKKNILRPTEQSMEAKTIPK